LLQNSTKRKTAKNATKRADQDVLELLRVVELFVAKNGPDLYLRMMQRLQLYTSTKSKNREV